MFHISLWGFLEDFHTSLVDICSGMCRVGFTGCDALRVIFPSGVVKPKMLCILAGMDLKDCYVTTWCTSSRLQTVESPQLQFIVCRRHLFRGAEAVSQCPDSSSDHRFSPVAVQGGRRPCLQVVQISLSWRRALSHGPDVWTIVIPQLQFFDMVIDAPVVQVCRFPVPSWWRQSSSHGCHLRKSSFPRGPGQGCRHARWRADMGQLIAVVMSRWALHTGAGRGVVSTGTRPP